MIFQNLNKFDFLELFVIMEDKKIMKVSLIRNNCKYFVRKIKGYEMVIVKFNYY